jgi:hypothetical protein
MSTSGSLVLFVSLGLILVVSMVAIGEFRSNVNDTNGSVQSSADLGVSAATPLFTVLGYLAIAVIAIALIKSFMGM